MNHIEEKPNQVNLSISWKDGRIEIADKPISSRIVLRPVAGTKSLMEVDVQMIISNKDADMIFDALAKGKIFLEINEA
jgi:hypothetical protein